MSVVPFWQEAVEQQAVQVDIARLRSGPSNDWPVSGGELSVDFTPAETLKRHVATALKSGPPPGMRGDLKAGLSDVALRTLQVAECYAWADWAWKAIIEAAKSVPLDATIYPSDLLGNAGWWYVPSVKTGLLWSWDNDFMFFESSFARDPKQLPPSVFPAAQVFPYQTWVWSRWQTIADVLTELANPKHPNGIPQVEHREVRTAHAQRLMQIFVAGTAWLSQRILVTDRQVVERHLRKRVSREQGLDAGGVQVITLRRIEHEHATPDGADPVEWSCRWLVRGHWRNQPCKDGRRTIYIMPFIKGPADKPLRIHEKTVFAVNR